MMDVSSPKLTKSPILLANAGMVLAPGRRGDAALRPPPLEPLAEAAKPQTGSCKTSAWEKWYFSYRRTGISNTGISNTGISVRNFPVPILPT